jgi:tetratricopeptide (TPR) repeat protein
MFLLLFVSCKKYLEKKPSNSIVSPSKVEDLQAVLDDATKMNEVLTPSYGEGSSDNYFLLQNDFNGRSTFSQNAYMWKPSDYIFTGTGNDWSFSYLPIYNSNYCLEMLEKTILISQNELGWRNVRGSALFYRAYNFLNLAWNHAKAFDLNSSKTDLGIVLRLKSDFNVPSVRSSVKECYDRIIIDAKEAAQYLPDIPLHPYRPSRAAAYGLLARTYLSMRYYDSALKYSNLCLQIKSDLIDCNITNSSDFATTNSAFPFKRFNKETIFYTEINGFVGLLALTRAKIDTPLVASFATDDIRRLAFFGTSNSYQNFKGSYSSTGNYFTGIATDEMYLVRAECYARAGNKTAAIVDLNALMEKRWKNNGTWVPFTASDPVDALNKILIERRKELVFRGLRWMDIKRLNKENANIILKRFINNQIITLQPNANYYALPLPSDIINLTGMPQNL